MVSLLTVVSVWLLVDSILANVNRVDEIRNATPSTHTYEPNAQIRDETNKSRSFWSIVLNGAIAKQGIVSNEDAIQRNNGSSDISTADMATSTQEATHLSTTHISTSTADTDMHVSTNLTVGKPTVTVPTQMLRKGEASPTRSAQVGMGLGITFIGILLIGEIVYFTRFYRRDQRHGDYQA